MYSYRAFNINNLNNENVFRVNEHHLKVYFDNFANENEYIGLHDPIYKD